MTVGNQPQTIEDCHVRIERLEKIILRSANAVKRLAFSMPPRNAYTPQFVMLALDMTALMHSAAPVGDEDGVCPSTIPLPL